jgi:hypothetical protein
VMMACTLLILFTTLQLWRLQFEDFAQPAEFSV